MSSYQDTLRFLYGLQLRGMKLGLQNTRLLVKYLGNPHRQFPCIHIAGSNGKGSTSAFLASVLTEAGLRTGLYTSPHLVRFTERIRIDGEEIPEMRLVDYASMIREVVEKSRATFFEATTAIMFRYFADEKVDVAIIETGLGGRFDATNVVLPMLSVITNVSLEHTEYLGNTIREIAREKAGIIKPSIPVVTAAEDPAVCDVLSGTAARRGSPIVQAGSLVSLRSSGGRNSVEIRLGRRPLFSARLGLTGRFQLQNAGLALAALLVLKSTPSGRSIAGSVDREAIIRGLSRVVRNSGLRGRMEALSRKGRRYLLDVAHNPDGLRTLLGSLSGRSKRPRVIIFGVLKDKDFRPMLRTVSEAADILVAVTPRTERALRSRSLVAAGRDLGIPLVDGGSVNRGLALANRLAGRKGEILVCGSHYIVGPVLQALGEEKA